MVEFIRLCVGILGALVKFRTADWVMQQARNANMWLDDMGVKPRFLIHDRDRKFPDEFKALWKSEGVRCIRIPIKAPRANAFAESWIESQRTWRQL